MPRSKTLVVNNPLTRFKDKFQEGYSGKSSWDEISGMCGLSRSYLISLCHLDEEAIKSVSLKTYLSIKQCLGVDLLNDWY